MQRVDKALGEAAAARSTEAAGVGFEPTSPRGLAVFKTAPFDRSGTPPRPHHRTRTRKPFRALAP
jgi:hypothetical protein